MQTEVAALRQPGRVVGLRILIAETAALFSCVMHRRVSTLGTLGDVLYAGSSKARVPESEWVALIRAIAAGDQLALHALFERSHRIAFTLIVRITGNRETAEEVTLDVFHDIWRRASAYDPANGTVLGWIMNQARSRAIDRLRFERRKKRTEACVHDPLPEAELDSQTLLESKEQGEVLRGAFAALNGGERQAIAAAFFSDLSHAEAAARLSQPLGTVKTRIRSGLEKLREALGRKKP
jgi:RNA polymerase sigma-70 factor (ECF subfamily)